MSQNNVSNIIHPTRRKAIVRALQSIAGISLMGEAFAQPNAAAPVKFIIASSPGTGPDTMSRFIQPTLQNRWNRPVVVDNRAGAGGVIGIDALAKSPPDGTAVMIQTSTMFLLPSFYKEIPFDVIKSFTPITQVATSTFALVVNNNVPAKNFRELVEWIKSKQGQVNYATPGKGTENHLFMELLKYQTGLQITHVPYRATANAIQDVIGDQVSMMFLPIPTAMQHVRSGRLKAIGATSKERFAVFKDVPTLYEQGLTGFDFSNWYGVWGPAGMSAELTSRYHDDLASVLNSPEISGKFAEQGWLVKTSTPAELEETAKTQLAKWREVVAQTKVQVD